MGHGLINLKKTFILKELKGSLGHFVFFVWSLKNKFRIKMCSIDNNFDKSLSEFVIYNLS